MSPGSDSGPTRRYADIVRAAQEVFLSEGFAAASIDSIVARASVSKQSIYRVFGDKRGLFVAVLSARVDEAGDAVAEHVSRLQVSGDLAGDLLALGRAQLRLVLTPELMRLRRTVIAEAERFPDLAATFFERGAERTIEVLKDLFTRWSNTGEVAMDDPALAATRFNWLLMADPVNRAMFTGLDHSPDDVQIDQWAAQAVEAFLAIYPVQPGVAP
ncbi:TetR/AcrR family transcriptional regulator [Microbacterium sp. C7(2022)]|uniref:TetR/AcrR family transcriptional regulator n=1 Tax=Microbacterium sp. C7(2022) TaxID=2992759 RepID=UPI00237C4299|nr:TetR/AcrR family transcriptional regulator [Microbacterium sp. C7(2022)]MDE0546684.1 TetR/AcrR family transcriptional regulator [Microbacterium sp. C7(2022)]